MWMILFSRRINAAAAFVGFFLAAASVAAVAADPQPSERLLIADFETEQSPNGGEMAPYGAAIANFNDRENPHSTLYLPDLPDYSLENVYRGKGAYRLINEMAEPKKDPWASLGINLGGTTSAASRDVSQFRYLVFWAKGKNGGERIRVVFRDVAAESYLPQCSVDPEPPMLTNRWQQFVVPLENISSAVDLTRLVHVGVEFGSWLGNLKGDTIYVDDFAFTQKTGQN